MNCPHCKRKINMGKIIGKLAKGHKKKFSKAEIAKRTKRLLENRFQPNAKERRAFNRMDN